MGDQRNGGIAWTEESWNPIRGCSRVSEGCRNCYAETMAARFSGPGQPYEGLIQIGSAGPRWNGKVRFVAEHLADPLRWKRPRRIFVNSMSDLFHEALTNEQIAAIFGVMAASPQHTFQVLTKRPARAREWFAWVASRPFEGPPAIPDGPWDPMAVALGHAKKAGVELPRAPRASAWPLPSVWLGVSVEDQKSADERIPLLLETPAAVRWVSYEPALGAVDVSRWLVERVPRDEAQDFGGAGVRPRLDWIVIGGESGPGARPFDVSWARTTIAACRRAGVACFVKQLGAKPRVVAGAEDVAYLASVRYAAGPVVLGETAELRHRKGGDPAEWPADLRVQQWPERLEGEVRS